MQAQVNLQVALLTRLNPGRHMAHSFTLVPQPAQFCKVQGRDGRVGGMQRQAARVDAILAGRLGATCSLRTWTLHGAQVFPRFANPGLHASHFWPLGPEHEAHAALGHCKGQEERRQESEGRAAQSTWSSC